MENNQKDYLACGVEFIVISVINCASTSDSYNVERSRYSADERFKQTLETIESIRVYAPSARILFIEGGSEEDKQLFQIKALVDEYLFLGSSRLVRLAVDSRHKTLGELALMIVALFVIGKSASDLVVKITGRYRLNKNFVVKEWNSKRYNFKLIDRNVSSRLYGFPRKKRLQLLLALVWGCLRAIQGRRMEQILHKSLLTHPRSYISTLGLEGEMGPTGKSIDE